MIVCVVWWLCGGGGFGKMWYVWFFVYFLVGWFRI